MYRTYKFMILPVLQDVDDDGKVTAEAQPEQPDTVFGIDGLLVYAHDFEERLATLVASSNGSPKRGSAVA